jgi:hypothetical protein
MKLFCSSSVKRATIPASTSTIRGLTCDPHRHHSNPSAGPWTTNMSQCLVRSSTMHNKDLERMHASVPHAWHRSPPFRDRRAAPECSPDASPRASGCRTAASACTHSFPAGQRPCFRQHQSLPFSHFSLNPKPWSGCVNHVLARSRCKLSRSQHRLAVHNHSGSTFTPTPTPTPTHTHYPSSLPHTRHPSTTHPHNPGTTRPSAPNTADAPGSR